MPIILKCDHCGAEARVPTYEDLQTLQTNLQASGVLTTADATAILGAVGAPEGAQHPAAVAALAANIEASKTSPGPQPAIAIPGEQPASSPQAAAQALTLGIPKPAQRAGLTGADALKAHGEAIAAAAAVASDAK